MSYHRTPKASYWCYFAQAGDMMKIGCSVEPEERLPQIAEWIPFNVELVAVVKGAFDLESDLHAYFADSWSHLEWFHVTPKMEALVADINAGRPINVPKCPRDAGKELFKTLKKRASHTVSAAERRAYPDYSYIERVRLRPQHIAAALESYQGPHNPPPTPEVVAAINEYAASLGYLAPDKAA